MFSIENLQQYLEEILNEQLAEVVSEEEAHRNPFRLFADVGAVARSYRNLNTVFSKRYGVISVLSSNLTPLYGIDIYTATASVDILVNVDEASVDIEDLGEYPPVKEARTILDNVAEKYSAISNTVTIGGKQYSVVPVFTLSTAGTFEVDTSELGKVVPLSFSIDLTVVQLGVNSSEIKIYMKPYDSTIEGDGTPVVASQIAEDMVISYEGQTRMGAEKSTFNAQEARYSLSFVSPFLNEWLQTDWAYAMHTGISPIYKVTVKYPNISKFVHIMKLSAVRLTAQIPNNAGFNIELVEIDAP